MMLGLILQVMSFTYKLNQLSRTVHWLFGLTLSVTMLTAKDVVVTKQGNKIIADINLQVMSSDISCIVGRNGAGKSTLLRAMVGLEPLTNGSVNYNEIDMTSADRYYALWELGVMLSNNSYYEYLTCVDNLKIIHRYYGQTRFTIEEILHLFNLSEFRDQKVRNLSSGTKQRLSLALTFINCPSLVLLDEPFNSIDRENTKQIVKLIRQMNKDYNTAFLITSHSFDDVEALYSELHIMKNGQIVNQLKRTDLEKYIYVRFKETALTISFEELSNKFFAIQRDDNYVSIIALPKQQEFHNIATAIDLQRSATPKDFYEFFG